MNHFNENININKPARTKASLSLHHYRIYFSEVSKEIYRIINFLDNVISTSEMLSIVYLTGF